MASARALEGLSTNNERFHLIQAENPEQKQARREWRQLCHALESAQGDELVQSCRDAWQFARTYQQYGRSYVRIADDARRAASQGNYAFFRQRGVPEEVLSPEFVDKLLRDWKSTIRSKKSRVAEIFSFRFHEPIDSFLSNHEESKRLLGAVALHDSDAVDQFSLVAEQTETRQEIATLRDEVNRLRQELGELRELVQGSLGDCPPATNPPLV